MKLLRRIFSHPVQITPYNRTPVIPIDHTIRIEHRNNVKHESLSHLLGLLIIGNEEINKALDFVASKGFSRMDSSCNYYCFLVIAADVAS